MTPKYPQVHVEIAGKDGVTVLNEVRAGLRSVASVEEIAIFENELHPTETRGGYNHTLEVCGKWVSMGEPGMA